MPVKMTALGKIRNIPPHTPIVIPEPLYFYPGNYIADTGSVNAHTAITSRLLAHPNWDGAMLRWHWNNLERAQGEYSWTESGASKGFAEIRHRALNMQSTGKQRQLIVFVQLKSFGASNRVVPAYMTSNAAYNHTFSAAGHPDLTFTGSFTYVSGNAGPGGCMPNFWNANVRARFNAMMVALANYIKDPANGIKHLIAGIHFSEAALAAPSAPTAWTVAQKTALTNNFNANHSHSWFTNYQDCLISGVKPSFDQHLLNQWFNSPRNEMDTFFPAIRAAGIGGSMTDAAMDDKGFWYDPAQNITTAPGNIWHLKQSDGIINKGMVVSNQAWAGSVAAKAQVVESAANFDVYRAYRNRTNFPAYNTVFQTPEELQAFGKNYIKSHFALWGHNTGANPLQPAKSNNQVADEWMDNVAKDHSVNTATFTNY